MNCNDNSRSMIILRTLRTNQIRSLYLKYTVDSALLAVHFRSMTKPIHSVSVSNTSSQLFTQLALTLLLAEETRRVGLHMVLALSSVEAIPMASRSRVKATAPSGLVKMSASISTVGQ